MRTYCLSLVLIAGLGVISCNRRDTAHREEPPARQLGREAYGASQQIKRGAKEAAHEIRQAGKQFREGWSEGKQEDPKNRRK
jgi:hypothetical protein